jgi:hypothetical protein
VAETPTFHVHDGALCVGTVRTNQPADPRRRSWGPGFASPDWETYNRLIDALEKRGFRFERDPRIVKHYPVLADKHHLGQVETPQGTLYVASETYPAGCKFEFFQEVVTVNPNGGRYDFDRVAKMPYLIRLKFKGSLAALCDHLSARGFRSRQKLSTPVLDTPIGHRLRVTDGTAEPDTLNAISWGARLYFNEAWNSESDVRGGAHRFHRGADGWPSDSGLRSSNPRHGRDGQLIQHGETRWIRDRKGYLRRGRVFGGINGMWVLIYGPGPRDHTQVSAGELFGSPKGLPRKAHPRPRKLTDVLAAAIKAEDFERAIILRDLVRARLEQAA